MALAVADYYNIPIDTIQKAILSFPKVARRMNVYEIDGLDM